MKLITVVSNTRSTGMTMKENLLSFLDDYIEVQCTLLSDVKYYDFRHSALILTSGNYNNVIDTLDKIDTINCPIITAERFVDYNNINELISIPESEKVLLINDDKLSAIETEIQLKIIGFDKFEYELYYPGKYSYVPRDIVITPGEIEFIPYRPKKIINLGSRKLSIGTLFEIIKTLNLPSFKNTEIMNSFLKDIVSLSRSCVLERNQGNILNDALKQVVEKVDYGICYIDNQGKIIFCNNIFAYYLGTKKANLINNNIGNYISALELDNNLLKELEIDLNLGKFKLKKDYSFPMFNGSILTLVKKTNNKKKLAKKLYNFEDYITNNYREENMLNDARNFSRLDSPILIQGESGTGKEILAQSIHSNSVRSNMPFIPINISTISQSLLESELFGYEKGSFTGGLVEGKEGIFEKANGGTIFLDEIGDIPKDIQVKLLRVLEEHSIRKVGSHDEIPIDVRIIAATNKDLFNETKSNNFRLDLYFRLNILPLNTTPLRNKPEDISLLLKNFLNINSNDDDFKNYFEKDTIDFLKKYSWPGNIRELKNLVLYLSAKNLNRPVKIEDLQNHMLKEINREDKSINLNTSEKIVLNLYYEENKVIGRIKASNLLESKGHEITPGKIKKILESLNNFKLLDYIKNKGYVISEKGITYINNL